MRIITRSTETKDCRLSLRESAPHQRTFAEQKATILPRVDYDRLVFVSMFVFMLKQCRLLFAIDGRD